MEVHVFDNSAGAGKAAAKAAGLAIKKAVERQTHSNIVLATGNSQLHMLEYLTKTKNIPWSKVSMFHLDEYLGMNETHPASFRRYLKEHFVQKVSPMKNIFFILGDYHDPIQECDRLSELISVNQIDVALIGIGENGHLAFNDPPADFDTTEPFLVVKLDDTCREQQLGEGWFSKLEEVPEKAISMSIYQIMLSKQLIVTVPDLRKARAVRDAVKGPLTNLCPASILRNHPLCSLFLDRDSASLL